MEPNHLILDAPFRIDNYNEQKYLNIFIDLEKSC